MSTQERNTHFQNSAQQVTYKILDLIPDSLHTYSRDDQKLIAETIAQYAYDLVFHILKNADSLYLDMGGYKDVPSDDTVVWNMKHLPDLTQWPVIELSSDLPPELAE